MKFFTHLAFGFFVGLLYLHFFPQQNQLLFMFFVLLATSMPDIDHPDSKIGRWFKPLGWLFSHRGFFHSLLAIILFAGLAHIFLKNIVITMAVIVGYSAHLLIDSLNHQGIHFLYPFKKLKIKGFMAVGGIAEFLILIALIVLGFFQLTGKFL